MPTVHSVSGAAMNGDGGRVTTSCGLMCEHARMGPRGLFDLGDLGAASTHEPEVTCAQCSAVREAQRSSVFGNVRPLRGTPRVAARAPEPLHPSFRPGPPGHPPGPSVGPFVGDIYTARPPEPEELARMERMRRRYEVVSLARELVLAGRSVESAFSIAREFVAASDKEAASEKETAGT